MSVKYICRHCQTKIGEISNGDVNEMRLGFHLLTPEERNEMVSYNQHGDITVKVVCDYCKEALDKNPELSLISNPLQ
ncbi:anti-sigma-F factor Fin family protein [Chengkuizengella marina]|uniref:Anti-sigma-F factor Fin family protein n=1 Tax=Chengkuizengella marina TaxID=2507566 RepID=A0A6N9Q7S3_9BACL|nr:anti-sigma-F factor Fin family protein [Chengkuizengella marina]NBI30810.1 anti-sigma-F factor Fin family protein [Chengkuizengella marina]